MCDNRTMPSKEISSRAELGARIGEARAAAGKTQSDLAESVGLERSQLAKMESGNRNVSATELVRIAGVLGRPLDWFVLESPPAVVSRRRSSTADFASLDDALEGLSRDVELLIGRRIINAGTRPRLKTPSNINQAVALAAEVRRLLNHVSGPLVDLQGACEELGLLAFAMRLGDGSGDAVYAEVESLGVAVINGSADDGRRRFSLAHELGHHIVGDAFEAVNLGSRTERLLDVFALHLLLPADSVRTSWTTLDRKFPTRLSALAIAVRFSVSWTAACNQLRYLGLISQEVRDELVSIQPEKWEHLELGENQVVELVAPSVPRGYARQVLEAYRGARLTAPKTVDLLRGSLKEEELPPLDELAEARLVDELSAGR